MSQRSDDVTLINRRANDALAGRGRGGARWMH